MKCSKDKKCKSGYQKRRQKELEEIANAASHPKQEKLDKFFRASQQHGENQTETLPIVNHPDKTVEDKIMIPDDSMTSPSLREMLLQKEPQQISEKYVESEEIF